MLSKLSAEFAAKLAFDNGQKLRLLPRRAGAMEPVAADAIGSGADAMGSGRADAMGSGRADAMGSGTADALGSGTADAMGPQTGKPGDSMALVLTTERGVNCPNGDIKGVGGYRTLAMEEGWQPGEYQINTTNDWDIGSIGKGAQRPCKLHPATTVHGAMRFVARSHRARMSAGMQVGPISVRIGTAVLYRSDHTMASAYPMKYTSNKCSKASP